METLSSVYKKYRLERPECGLTEEEFEYLVNIFPAILVSAADGFVDTSEMIHLQKLFKYMSATVSPNRESILKNEVRYLARDYRHWRKPFLDLIKERLKQNDHAEMLLELMIAAANSSTGNLLNNILLQTLPPNAQNDPRINSLKKTVEYISKSEKDEIYRIINELELTKNNVIMDRLLSIMIN